MNRKRISSISSISSILILVLLLHGCASLNMTRSDECVSGDCHTGEGILVSANGARYEGQFLIGKRHGKGTYTLPNGASYEGEWNYDKLFGPGTITFPDGARYIGTVKDSKPDGQGVIVQPDGTRIEGNFENGQFVTSNVTAGISAPETLPAAQKGEPAAVVAEPAPPAVSKETNRPGGDLKAYCRKVAEANNGSYQVEETCLGMTQKENESLARTTLTHMNIPPRIQGYCQGIADASAGSFSAMLSCVQKELAAMERLR